MKENKQLLETIWSQAKHGLKFTDEFGTIQQVTAVLCNNKVEYHDDSSGYEIVDFDENKYHLLPLSMLTKPIRIEGYNDGNEITPMYELLKITGVGTDISDCLIRTEGAEGFLGIVTAVVHEIHWGSIGKLTYDESTTSFYSDEMFPDGECHSSGVSPQLEMFNLMHRLHFNVFNLDETQFIDASISKAYEPK